MKLSLLFISIAVVYISCDTKEKINQKSEVAFTYDSLYKKIECDDSKFEIESKILEDSIRNYISEQLNNLENKISDTVILKSVDEVFKEESENFTQRATKEADLIFWSYGVASYTGERKVAKNCYYLQELKRRFGLYKMLFNNLFRKIGAL